MQDIDSYVVETELGRIAVRDTRGGAMPLLLLHGGGYSGDIFSAQLNDTELRGFRLIVPDLPGHGESDNAAHPESGYSVSGLASAIAALIEELGLVNCVVAGWSLGGHVAIELLGAHCSIAGVAITGAPPLVQGGLGMIRGFHFSRDMLLASKAKLMEHEAARYMRMTLGPDAPHEFADLILRADPQSRPVAMRSLVSGQGCDQRDTVESSPVPVCLIQGQNDPFARTGYVTGIRGNAIYEGGCKVIAGAGHAPFLDAPGEFNALLADFARDVASGKASVAPADPMRIAV